MYYCRWSERRSSKQSEDRMGIVYIINIAVCHQAGMEKSKWIYEPIFWIQFNLNFSRSYNFQWNAWVLIIRLSDIQISSVDVCCDLARKFSLEINISSDWNPANVISYLIVFSLFVTMFLSTYRNMTFYPFHTNILDNCHHIFSNFILIKV